MNVASMLTMVAAVGALWFTNNTLRVTQDQASATHGQLELSQRTAVTDMFQKAVEMLKSDGEPGEPEKIGIDARIAGIRLLERLAQESPRDRRLAYQTIATFVQTRAPLSTCKEWDDLFDRMGDESTAVRQERLQEHLENLQDITVALAAIGNRTRDAESDTDQIDLSKSCLRNREFIGNFANVRFSGADLAVTAFVDADLTGADFKSADLRSTSWAMYLRDVPVPNVTLTGAIFGLADLAGADLTGVDLTGVNLYGSNLEGATLVGTNFTRALGELKSQLRRRCSGGLRSSGADRHLLLQGHQMAGRVCAPCICGARFRSHESGM
ncbi:pentapeptide repeat-containing protein [Nocardia sp. NPDC050378]|uniref:pentapeptide repeat-containing protein n=1 Tax=Nocardia sp. NPDC050378 TaxID=3155400 RepID=UPI003405CAE6